MTGAAGFTCPGPPQFQMLKGGQTGRGGFLHEGSSVAAWLLGPGSPPLKAVMLTLCLGTSCVLGAFCPVSHLLSPGPHAGDMYLHYAYFADEKAEAQSNSLTCLQQVWKSRSQKGGILFSGRAPTHLACCISLATPPSLRQRRPPQNSG